MFGGKDGDETPCIFPSSGRVSNFKTTQPQGYLYKYERVGGVFCPLCYPRASSSSSSESVADIIAIRDREWEETLSSIFTTQTPPFRISRSPALLYLQTKNDFIISSVPVNMYLTAHRNPLTIHPGTGSGYMGFVLNNSLCLHTDVCFDIFHFNLFQYWIEIQI